MTDPPPKGPPPLPPDVAAYNEADDPTMRMLLPVGRSGYAIAAGYLGLLSVLMIFAPLALLFGILALLDIKKNPKKLGAGRAWFGIIMGAVFTPLLLVMIFAIATGR